MPKTYYDILNVKQTADSVEIKQAAQTRVNVIKTKLAGLIEDTRYENFKKSAQIKINEIKTAYTILSDVEKRKHYDATLTQIEQSTTPSHSNIQLPSNSPVIALKQKSLLSEVTPVSPENYQLATSNTTSPVIALKQKSLLPEATPLSPKSQQLITKKTASPPIDIWQPYEPPQADLIDHALEEPFELAGRFTRLRAVFIDGFTVMILVVGIAIVLTRTGHSQLGIIAFFLGMFALGITNLVLLYKNGQTVGKYLLAIKIVRSDGSRAGLARILFLRILVVALIGAIPVIGSFFPIINVLFIFQESRRCIHDLIADTIVIRA